MEYVTPDQTVIDGVTTLHLRVPGPMRAMLLFRVGAADEALPKRGITHLAEHLALRTLIQRFEPWQVTGSVGPYYTRIGLTGTAEEITSFLAEVTRNLAELPTDRLEDEKRLLRTEAASRRTGSAKELWSYRFGAQGLGVADYQEFGCRWLDADSIREWSADRFNAGNAVLWLSDDPPEGLRLYLKPGRRYPRTALKPLDFATPALYAYGSHEVAMSMIAPSSRALFLGALILNARVRKRLRHEQSLAYDAHAFRTPIGVRTYEVVAFADSLSEHARETVEALVSTVRELAATGHETQEMVDVVNSFRRVRSENDAGLGLLDDASMAELNGVPDWTWPDVDAYAAAMTSSDTAAVFTEAFKTALLAIPDGVDCDLEGFTPLPASTGGAIVASPTFSVTGKDHPETIEYSPLGMYLTKADKTTVGIRWAEIAAALWWVDGKRVVIGTDAAYINVMPDRLNSPQGLLDAMRRWVPAETWVPMGAGD